jgi:hypothetical protein
MVLMKIDENLLFSDKTVRLFRWEVGKGFTEAKNSPFKAHKYAVTKVAFSPKVQVNFN